MNSDFIFTSESSTAGHPDKLCDQVSDAIVDHYLTQDPYARIIAECALASGVMFISTHYASQAKLDIPDIARQVIREIGYPKEVFDADACTIMTSFMDQTATDYLPLDLNQLDDRQIDQVTAKQQVTEFGYACDQTTALMPLPIWLAHRLARQLADKKTVKKLPYLLPDGKTQVGIAYKDGQPERIHSLTLVASQTELDAVNLKQLEEDLVREAVIPVLDKESFQADQNTRIFINPEGPLIGGGPAAHAGLTGRKTGNDTYGAYARNSSAALSGKDPMRIDRVGAYAARYIAKNVVAAGLARECEVQLSYTIGVAAPVSMRVRTFDTGEIDDRQLTKRVAEVFDCRLGAIVRDFHLQQLPGESQDGFFRKLAIYGQLGRTDMETPWEKTDKIEALK